MSFQLPTCLVFKPPVEDRGICRDDCHGGLEGNRGGLNNNVSNVREQLDKSEGQTSGTDHQKQSINGPGQATDVGNKPQSTVVDLVPKPSMFDCNCSSSRLSCGKAR